MNTKLKHNPNLNTNGTGLVGYIDITYKELVNVFGEPGKGDGYKVDAEWNIKTPNGLIATIYNYKTGKNYLGDKGLNVEDITKWHIGGKNDEVVELVDLAMAYSR